MGNFNNGGFSPSNTVTTDLEVDEGTISVDTSNNFVGIGTTTPVSDLTIQGTVTIRERTNAKGDNALYGQLWVKDSNPNELYYTTGEGNDVQITDGTGLAASSSSSAVKADDIQEGDAAVTIKTSSGAINIGHADNDEVINIGAGGTGAITIGNATAGAISIDSASPISIDTAGAAANISHTATAGGDFTVAMDASADASLILTSAGTAADALQISTTAGGMDISVTGAAAGEDLDISCNQEIRVTSTSNAAEAIILEENGGASGTIKIYANQGEVDGAAGAGSILLASDAGGIGLSWADGKDLWAEGGRAVITANEDAANCIKLHADAGTSQTITVVNDAGTSESAIALTSTAGGVDIDAAAGKDVTIDGGQLLFTSAHDTASAIYLRANAGTSETIKIHADQGNTDGSAGAGSILLASDDGGIGLSWHDGKDLWAEGGRAVITANEDAADCIKLHADAGTSQTIKILNDEGTTTGAEAEGAILIEATAGGIGLHGADNKRIWAEAGQVIVTANQDASDAIKIHADAGTSQTITVVNDAGTAAGAVDITSTAGGISMTAGHASHGVQVTTPSFLITSSKDDADAPTLEIKNTDNGGYAGVLKFNNTESGQDGADDDDLGSIQFWGNDDGTPTAQQYANIIAEIHDATSNEESGKLVLQVATHDGDLDSGLMLIGSDADGKVDVTLGNGSSQVTTVAGNLKVVGNVIQASDGGSTITMDTSDNVTVAGKVTATGGIDSSTTVDITHSTTANGLSITTNSITTGAACNITANGLTTGAALNVTSTSTDKTGTSVLAKFLSDGDRGDDSAPHIGVMIDFDSTAGTAAKAFYIDSEQTTGRVIDVDADAITTGTALEISTDARTTGTALNISDSATGDNAGSLVKIAQTGNRAGSAASVGLDIDFDTVANANARAFRIDSEQSTGIVAEINGDGVTTGSVVDISANGLTTGAAFEVSDDSSNGGTRSTAAIDQLNAAAIAATALEVKSHGGITGMLLDKNYSHASAATVKGLFIDLDKTAATTTNNTIVGLDIDADNTTATNGSNTLIGARITPTLTHAADAGTAVCIGQSIVATGGTNGTGVAVALELTATGGDSNTHIEMLSGADANDKCQIAVGNAGATTITTIDDSAAAAHLEFEIDGDFEVETAGATGITFQQAAFTANGGAWNGITGSVVGNVSKINGEIVTTILVDIHGTDADGDEHDVIGKSGQSNSYLTRITTAVNGVVYKAEMACVETPTGGGSQLHIDLIANASDLAEGADGNAGGSSRKGLVFPSDNWEIGMYEDAPPEASFTGGLANDYLYLTCGDSSGTGGTFTAGKFIIKLYGAAA